MIRPIEKHEIEVLAVRWEWTNSNQNIVILDRCKIADDEGYVSGNLDLEFIENVLAEARGEEVEW